MSQRQYLAVNPRRYAYVVVRCPQHQDAPLFEDVKGGEQICTVCGYVVAVRVMDGESEWRTLRLTDYPGYPVGAAQKPLLNGADLTPPISNEEKGSAAVDEIPKRKYTKKTESNLLVTESWKKDRDLLNGFNEIGAIAEKLGVTKAVAARAKMRLKEFQEASGSNKLRSNNAMAAASLFLACREESIPRTFKELCGVSNTTKKDIGRCFNAMMKVLNIDLDHLNTDNFVTRFCNVLGMPAHVQAGAAAIAKTAVEIDLVPGLSPITVVATAIFMASQLSEVKRSRKEVCQSTGVAEATVRRTYKDFYPKAEQLFPKDFPFVTPIDLLPLP